MNNSSNYEKQLGHEKDMGTGTLSSNTCLINDVSKAIIGEVHAFNFYKRLAELAPIEQSRKKILSIRLDEVKHYHWFSMILRGLGGQQPQILTSPIPITYREGVRKAIWDESESAAFYKDISYRATDLPTNKFFMDAAHDEQRHASWFQYMLIDL
ncbi:MAG: ferritin-like domain-containing protein [Paenibacillus sp.]|nr:ferritin-like domain-containing protein [Paenibacillus sp.]